MKYCIPILLSLLVVCFAQTEISGALSGTLDVGDSPYNVTDDIFIPSGEELTIEPGCELNFMGDYVIFVSYNSSLICRGSEEDSIVFTCDETLPVSDEARYNGIVAIGPEFVHFEYCVFENAYSSSSAVVYIHDYDSLGIMNCRFSNNRAFGSSDNLTSLCFFGDNLYLKNSKFNNNYGEDAGCVICNGVLTVDSCSFIENESESNAGAIFIDDYYSCLVTGSEFYGNSASNNGGVIYLSSLTPHNIPVVIEKSIFAFNTAEENGGVIELFNNVNSINITNSVFFANEAHCGAILHWYDSLSSINMKMVNCTCYENVANYGYAMYFYGASINGCIMNSIFYNDMIIDNYLIGRFDSVGRVDIVNSILISSRFSNLSHLTAKYHNCFYRNPGFIDEDYSDGEFDLSLSSGSPCIDNGLYAFGDSIIIYACEDDITSESRPNRYAFDIGAYEYPGEYENRAPVIACPPGFETVFCEYDTLFIRVDDLYMSRLEFECLDSNYFVDEYDSPHSINDTLIRLIPNPEVFAPSGRDIQIVASDGEFADTCTFTYDCIPVYNDTIGCERINVDIFVGSLDDSIEFLFSGMALDTFVNVYMEELEDFVVEESLVAIGRHYDYRIVLSADESQVGEYVCNLDFYDNTRFRCIEFHINVVEIENYPPEFYGCPDTLVTLLPSEMTFVYLQVEDPEDDEFTIELDECPSPYEGFWDFREEIIGNIHHIYMQFYPNFDDTGMHVFRFIAEDENGESECLVFTYVTKDTSDMCPYVEPDTVYIEYLEGEFDFGEVTIYDLYDIHHWHIEADCGSLLCVYPQFGVGTQTSHIIPECGYNTCELVFAIDVTGSMGGYINRMIDNLSAFILMMDSAMVDVKYGLCPFTDDAWSVDMDDYMPGVNLTASSGTILRALDSLYASGGGDGPENPLDAIAEAINNYDWTVNSYKQIIILTDNRYHFRDDGTVYCDYVPEEINDMLLANDITLSVIFSSSYMEPPEWYLSGPELTGGEYYDEDMDYNDLFTNILIEMSYVTSMPSFSDGVYECNLTYVMDYPVTCRSIDVPVVINILDTSDTYNTYNCPDDTLIIHPGVCDTINITSEFRYCEFQDVDLVDYPIDHVDMWTYDDEWGDGIIENYFIFNADEEDSGVYHYSFEYQNEYGADTCSFYVRVLSVRPFYRFYEGWNLLSYPFIEPNGELITLNPDFVRPYTWNAIDYTYELPEEITRADAFWYYSNCEMFYNVHRTLISEVTTTLYAGWNLVSSTGDTLNADILVAHPEIISPVYRYNTNAGAYETVSEIIPGIGYWLMSAETFEITYPE